MLPVSTTYAGHEPAPSVLIVDDNAVGRQSVETTLDGQGYQLRFAATGADALTQAASAPPDLILLDVMMPDMDGFEVCRRLRAEPALREVPIILLTALEDRGSRLRGLEAGADEFLSKPFDRAELRARVRTITRLNRYRNLWVERAKLESLTDLSPDGILVVDGAGQMRFANAAAASLLGVDSATELVGRRLTEFMLRPRPATRPDPIEQVRTTQGASVQVEAEIVRADGRSFPAEVRVGRMAWAGEAMVQVILRDIAERYRLHAELEARHQELQQLLQRLVAVQEAERRFMAVELHDEVGQSLTGLKLLLETSAPLGPDALRARLSEVRVLVKELLGRVRELSLDLRPAMLDDVGLFAALDWQCERFERQSRLTIKRNFDPLETQRFAPEVEIAAFRIAQEALTNVARHAQIMQAVVDVSVNDGILHVAIRDNGAGFQTGALDSKKHPSNGLAGMRERARSVSGDVTILSAPGQGTTIRAVFPLGVEPNLMEAAGA